MYSGQALAHSSEDSCQRSGVPTTLGLWKDGTSGQHLVRTVYRRARKQNGRDGGLTFPLKDRSSGIKDFP